MSLTPTTCPERASHFLFPPILSRSVARSWKQALARILWMVGSAFSCITRLVDVRDHRWHSVRKVRIPFGQVLALAVWTICDWTCT